MCGGVAGMHAVSPIFLTFRSLDGSEKMGRLVLAGRGATAGRAGAAQGRAAGPPDDIISIRHR
nr:hypothetical protein SHINE37_41076 [Rhizobiaceae bacterium]